MSFSNNIDNIMEYVAAHYKEQHKGVPLSQTRLNIETKGFPEPFVVKTICLMPGCLKPIITN